MCSVLCGGVSSLPRCQSSCPLRGSGPHGASGVYARASICHIRLYLATFQLPWAMSCCMEVTFYSLSCHLLWCHGGQGGPDRRGPGPLGLPETAAQPWALPPRAEAAPHISKPSGRICVTEPSVTLQGQQPRSSATSPPCAVPVDRRPSPPVLSHHTLKAHLFPYNRFQPPTGLERGRQQSWVLRKPGTWGSIVRDDSGCRAQAF